MKLHRLLVLACACSWALGASAQWQWLDKDGRKVFSDRPPPADVPAKSILKQPGGAPPLPRAQAVPADAAGSAPVAGAPAASASVASAPRLPGTDKELEQRKAQAEAADAARKKADEDRQAKARADNCQRARQQKATMTSGQLLSTVNAKGERSFMDEATRNAEVSRADAVIASDCPR
ncbi:DUF4124 domain-containing protein [Acidovorax sp. GBBC 3334]|uniref:DUF4124 domain-containing protein n=1 Tax=Acidovorax sp. GBBC 3334 TaxID=2940496 RepID=UPI002303AF22|nr:DUF4124 domain-containing protein [Acidovorax sp. GBBC 3334]MDA8456803.1 DUF4124 domain-containing protein [Acidovorax sp. GBBC 3334]